MGKTDPKAIAAAFLPDPLPTVVERESESAWSEFRELQSVDDRRYITTLIASSFPDDVGPEQRPFANTEPAPGRALPDPRGASLRGDVTVEAVMLVARRNGRVCPRQEVWLRLYELLPGKRTHGPVWQPSPPVSQEAWEVSSAVAKRLVLREQLEWAARRKALPQILAFLIGLGEGDWHHAGESI